MQTLLLPGGPNALLRRAVVGESQGKLGRTNIFLMDRPFDSAQDRPGG